ncbi:MAG: family 43 glycosylhydrolase [Clostridiales Family XIII bacterium]|jgi:hypothetical protein|nr:family 43 glycosylhydrolase [Clostridiales Family XIII bacterium]
MKKAIAIALTLIFVLTTSVFTSGAAAPELVAPSNPIVKTIFTADPSAHVWPTNPDKLYLYPSRDQDPAQGCDLMDKYHVYSTTDMVNWTDEGEILNSDEVAWGRAEGGFMWAPDAAYKDGTYYFYYPHPTDTNWGSSWEVGVATSKYPDRNFVDQGPIKDATTRPDATAESNRRDGMIDPNVFIDSDGTPYMFIGGSQRLYYGEMNPDMVSMKNPGAAALTRIPGTQVPNYHEGPWVFKRGDIYYLTYPGGPRTGAPYNQTAVVDGKRSDYMHYSTSASINGPWVPSGSFHYPVNTGDTSHGSVVEFKGRWFLFYHNAEVYSANAGNTTGNLRSVAVDELFFNEDGTIRMVTQTATGPAPIADPAPAPIRATSAYPASAAVLSGGSASLVANAGWDGGQVITGLVSAANTATFNGVTGGANGGRGTISIRYAASERRSVRLNVNGYDWGNINLVGTGGNDVFVREAEFTVTNLKPGATNQVSIIGRQNGAFSIAQIAVTPFEDEIIPDLAQIDELTVTPVLAAGYAAKVKFTATGTNLAGKTLRAYLFGLDPVDIVATGDTVNGTISVPASVWEPATMQITKEPRDFQLGVSVIGQKASKSATLTVQPAPEIMWKVWTEDEGGKLQLKFNADISASTPTLTVNGDAISSGSYSITPDNKILTDIDFASLPDSAPIAVSGIKLPMFLDYSFTYNTNKSVVEPPPPPTTYYSVETATVGGGANRGRNTASPTGYQVGDMHNGGAYTEWANVDGKEAGGKFVIGVYYATQDNAPSFTVRVNGVDAGRVTMRSTGDWNTFTGYSELDLTRELLPGTVNTIRLVGGSGGANIAQISMTPAVE